MSAGTVSSSRVAFCSVCEYSSDFVPVIRSVASNLTMTAYGAGGEYADSSTVGSAVVGSVAVL